MDESDMSQATDKDGKAVDTDSVYEKQPSGNTAGLEPDANVWSGNVDVINTLLKSKGLPPKNLAITIFGSSTLHQKIPQGAQAVPRLFFLTSHLGFLALL